MSDSRNEVILTKEEQYRLIRKIKELIAEGKIRLTHTERFCAHIYGKLYIEYTPMMMNPSEGYASIFISECDHDSPFFTRPGYMKYVVKSMGDDLNLSMAAYDILNCVKDFDMEIVTEEINNIYNL